MSTRANPARVSNLEKCCYNISSCYLQLINAVDFCLGLSFIVFGIYLSTKLGNGFSDPTVAWVGWSALLIGTLLILLCGLTFMAMTCTTSCLCMLSSSDVLIVLINVSCLVLGVLAFELHELFIDTLRDHGSEWGLSTQDRDDIDHWYYFIAISFFLVIFLQTIRFVCNRYFKKTSRRLDNEHDALLQQDNQQWEDKLAARTSETEQKYKDLRAYYKNKYQRPSSHDDLTKLNQQM